MVSWARVRYRIAQFCHTFFASFLSVDVAYVRRYLPEHLLPLFQKMPRAEQHHGIAVCQALEQAGYQDIDLLTAALLHDVGKCVATPRLWERVVVVLVEHYAPHLAMRWGNGEPQGLRRGFMVRYQHPHWGAEMAESAGASARVVSLIRQHHTPVVGDAALVALQTADDG
ncbi:MAG: HDIG domain-containing protein [Anaerolineae bacterium]|nr:HDIG domain-containing protein [Anaerolineae bacterium]